MSVLAAFVLPIIAVWATVEAVRTAPVALANVRVRRRLRSDRTPSRNPSTTSTVSLTPMPAVLARRLEIRRRWSRDRAVPERLDRIVRRLRTGATLPTAIVGVGTGDDVLSSLADDLRRGRPLVESVRRWGASEPSPNRRLAATALELTADAGGASARVLDGVAESLRDRVALDREVTALSSQSRASAALLVVAPLVFTVLAGSIDRRILTTLTGTPIGWVCLALGLTLDALGALWMARLVGRHR